MSNNSDLVAIAVTGAVSKVSTGYVIASAEQDLSTDTGLVNYGLVSSDGVTISTDKTTNNIVSWQYSSVVRVASTEATTTYTFTLLQNSKEARELYFGSDEVGGKINWKPSKMFRGRFVIDFLDPEFGGGENEAYGRHVINRGAVTSVGDLVFQNGEPIGYEVTITAYPDADGVCAEVYSSTDYTGS